MSDPQEYTLRWRGNSSGPFSVTEINRMLDDHEIGTGHEILCQNQWITLEEFLQAQSDAAASAESSRKSATPSMTLAPFPGVAVDRGSPLRIKLSVTPASAGAKPANQSASPQNSPRHRLLFAVLALLAGYAGIHNFYARQWLTGLLQMLLSVATFLMGFGLIASWLWAVVEALLVRRDAAGAEMV